MNQAIILHGGPSKEEYYDPRFPSASNYHWIPWLQKQLLIHDIATHTPEVPKAYDRNWHVWSHEIDRYDIDSNTALIGHSTGAGFFIKYLSIHPEIKAHKLILVAPWLDPYQEHTKDFFDDFDIDPQLVNRVKNIIIFNSDNDEKSIHKTVEIIRSKLSTVICKNFHNYGHFTQNDMATSEFPELLDEVISS